MQNHLRHFSVLWLLFIFMLTGCALTLKQINQRLGNAQIALNNAFEIVLVEGNSDDFTQLKKIEQKLNKLTSNWENNKDTGISFQKYGDDADIIEKQCLAMIDKSRKKLARRIESMKAEFPANEKLIKYLDYLYDRYVMDHPGPSNEKQVINLETQTAFKLGQYNLSGKGKREIKKFYTEKILPYISTAQAWEINTPIVSLNVMINVTGYTDSIGFQENRTRRLQNNCPDIDFSNPDKKRQSLNQCLSRMRSRTICDYLKNLIKKERRRPKHIKINVITNPMGKGEELPPGIINNSYKADPRRRICIIHCQVASVLANESVIK